MGLLVSIEETGYVGDSTARVTELLQDWSVRKIKKLSGNVSLLEKIFSICVPLRGNAPFTR